MVKCFRNFRVLCCWKQHKVQLKDVPEIMNYSVFLQVENLSHCNYDLAANQAIISWQRNIKFLLEN